jgi:hypothetical protein
MEETVRTELASAAKFGALLEKLGVEIPMKVSPTNPAKMTPALAKTDEAFIALQTHKNPLIAAAAMARLEVKSTLLETRLEAFIKAANVCDGKIPVPLKYAGADTTVLSMPTAQAPASTMSGIRCPRLAITCSAVVGERWSEGLALGAASGKSHSRIRD